MRAGWTLLLLLSSCSLARSFDELTDGPCGAAFPMGWTVLPDTRIVDLCSPDDPLSGCADMVHLASAVADTRRCRMVVWGGWDDGVGDVGNEVYALDVPTRKMLRLTEPSADHTTECVDILADGTPQGRQISDGLVYLPEADRMVAMGGYLHCVPRRQTATTWALDLARLAWTKLQDAPTFFLSAAAYDSTTRKVFAYNGGALFDYEEATGYRPLNEGGGRGWTMAAVDTSDHRLFFFGGGSGSNASIAFTDIGPSAPSPASFTSVPIIGSGCELLGGQPFPGVAYDPTKNRFVGWPGGAGVIVFDPNTGMCTTVTPAISGDGAPPAPTHIAGRWQYFPAADAFVAIPDGTNDAWVLRLP